MASHWRAFAFAVAVGAATVLPGFMVGILALQIRADLDAGVSTIAAGLSVFFAAGAFAAGPGGRVVQRVGALASLRASVLLSAACQFGIAVFARSLASLFALLVIAGCANAVTHPAVNMFLAEEVPLRRQGFAFGLKQAAIPAAVLVSGLALPLVALPFGWRYAFGLTALGTLGVALVVARSQPAEPVAREPHRGPRAPRPLLAMAVAAALGSSGANALGAYLVVSAVDVGIEQGAAGVLAAAGSGVSLLLRVVLGRRADRRGDYGFSAVIVLMGAGSLGFGLMASDTQAGLVLGSLAAFALGWGWPGLFNLSVVHRYRGIPAAATGITQTGIYVGAAAGPAAYGLVADEVGYAGAWAVAGALILLGALVMWLAGRLEDG